MHYIRFLSTPQVTATPRRTVAISAPVAVATDLGDAYLLEDVELIIRVIGVSTGAILVEQKFFCKGGSRALKTIVQCNGKYLGCSVRVHVTTAETQQSLKSREIPRILDVWSHEFSIVDKTRSEPLVARQIVAGQSQTLQIWEETGDSIARHVWDASLGFLTYLQLALEPGQIHGVGELRSLLRESGTRSLQVLELGTGCGTVGIAFAQQVECDLLLTDLEDAMEILESNIRAASPTARSSLQKRELDWGTDLEECVKQPYDLILVSDCIYNPDSSILLVQTLVQLAECAPNTLIVVGFKRRHSADEVFFEHMSRYGFHVKETHDVELPHIASDSDAYKPIIEFHIFRCPAGTRNKMDGNA